MSQADEAAQISCSTLADTLSRQAELYTIIESLNNEYMAFLDSLAHEENRVLGWIREGGRENLNKALIYFKGFMQDAIQFMDEVLVDPHDNP